MRAHVESDCGQLLEDIKATIEVLSTTKGSSIQMYIIQLLQRRWKIQPQHVSREANQLLMA